MRPIEFVIVKSYDQLKFIHTYSRSIAYFWLIQKWLYPIMIQLKELKHTLNFLLHTFV